MQIRVANRQDEPAVRAIVNETRAEHGEPEIDLTGADADLNNVEAHYFWNDGVFLVAEEDNKIVGLLGARRGATEETLEVLRLAVASDRRGKGVARRLLDTALFFAGNLKYQRILVEPRRQHLDANRPFHGFAIATHNPGIWVSELGDRAARVV